MIQRLNKKKKATKHINAEMDEYVEEFYNTKKEKDDGLSLSVIVRLLKNRYKKSICQQSETTIFICYSNSNI